MDGFSLVISTIGRTRELECLLASLASQTFTDFEAIVVDQNDDDRVIPVIEQFSDSIALVHVRSSRGLSRGRNEGLRHAQRTWVGFPDDDCEYRAETLERAAAAFMSHPDAGAICGRCVDADGRDAGARFARHPGWVDKRNMWRRHISVTMFFQRAAVELIGDFDERIGSGAGTALSAGEESDYLCRVLDAGVGVYYNPDVEVLHPPVPVDWSPRGRSRAASYGRAMGYILRTHGYPIWFAAYVVLRPAVGAIIDVGRGRFGSALCRVTVSASRASGYVTRVDDVTPTPAPAREVAQP